MLNFEITTGQTDGVFWRKIALGVSAKIKIGEDLEGEIFQHTTKKFSSQYFVETADQAEEAVVGDKFLKNILKNKANEWIKSVKIEHPQATFCYD